MPTFVNLKLIKIVYQNGTAVETIVGADIRKVENVLSSLGGSSAGGSFQGKGYTLSGNPVQEQSQQYSSDRIVLIVIGALFLYLYFSQ